MGDTHNEVMGSDRLVGRLGGGSNSEGLISKVGHLLSEGSLPGKRGV